MTTTSIDVVNGYPILFLDQKPVNPTTAYVGPRYVSTFLEAGIRLFTFGVLGNWWIGPQKYEFAEIDEFITDYVKRIPGAFFMPRIDLAHQGYPWWGKLYPQEVDLLLDIESGEPRDPLSPNPAAIPFLGHEVNLAGLNLHSFHSKVWREQAGEAISELIRHCEGMDYADQIWAWHLCDGLFCEWFHWHEYSFGALSDYSPAAQEDFRSWLRTEYRGDVDALSAAWGRAVEFERVTIPTPRERTRVSLGEFYDPETNRAAIDYSMCFSQSVADSLISICKSVKQALPSPKVTCVFYGYQFNMMPRPQLNGHYALNKVLASKSIDLIASPHAYGYRGEGGYHAPQSLAETIRRAGKIHYDEIDCKTVWTPSTVTWKTHISQPKTVSATIEMMKKDAAFAIASGTSFWWMDLTDEGWFFSPEVVDPIRRIFRLEDLVANQDRGSSSEIALVVSQKAMHFIAPTDHLHGTAQKIFRNWHLSRIGAPFDTLEVNELEKVDLSAYRLFIMGNLFYLSEDERRIINQHIEKNGRTILWVYAPGFLDDRNASLNNMESVTGIRFGMQDLHDELNVRITRYDHPISQGLSPGFQYGTGLDRQQYLNPPKIQYMPDTRASPAFFVSDPESLVLGLAASTGEPGLVVKEFDGWRSIYSSAPVLSWILLQNIARYAGVHIYLDQGDMVWANKSFIAIYSQIVGRKTLHIPVARDIFDAYSQGLVSSNTSSLEFPMGKWETILFVLRKSTDSIND